MKNLVKVVGILGCAGVVLAYTRVGTSNRWDATAFNQGRHLVRIPNDDVLYAAWHTLWKVGEVESLRVFLNRSDDAGETWPSLEPLPEFYQSSAFPSLAAVPSGLGIAFLSGVPESARGSEVWVRTHHLPMSHVQGHYWKLDSSSYFGPPSMAGWQSADTVLLGVTYLEDTNPDTLWICEAWFRIFNDTLFLVAPPFRQRITSASELGSPMIAVDPKGLFHIVWQEGPEVWYSSRYTTSRISLPGAVARHPFVDVYGDRVYVSWTEGSPGEVVARYLDISDPRRPEWCPPLNQPPDTISQTPD